MADLTPKQRQAAFLVATGISYREVAKAVGVTPQTMTQWVAKKPFQAVVNTHLEQTEKASSSVVLALRNASIQRLSELVQSKHESVAMRAIQLVLETPHARPRAPTSADAEAWQDLLSEIRKHENDANPFF